MIYTCPLTLSSAEEVGGGGRGGGGVSLNLLEQVQCIENPSGVAVAAILLTLTGVSSSYQEITMQTYTHK